MDALERSKGLFGVNSPTTLLNVGNVSAVCSLLREKVDKWLPASSLLEAELGKAAHKLGLPPRQSHRAKTNQEALALLKAMKAASGDIALVTVLAAHSLTSLSNPLSLAMSKADGVAEAMRRILWPLVDALGSITDGRRTDAQRILGNLRKGFERDEHALAFAPKVEDFTQEAASLLALVRVVEPPARAMETPPLPAVVSQAAPVPVVLPKAAAVAPRNKRSQAKGDSVAAWVPQAIANHTLLEVTVRTWIGSGRGMTPTMARGVQTALTSEAVPAQWSERARTAMEQQRKEFSFLSLDANTLVVSARDERVQWYTFGGSMVNQILAQHFTEFCGLPSEGNELAVSFDLRMDAHALQDKIHGVEVEDVLARMSFDTEAVESLKFHQTLPPELQQRVLRARLVDRAALRRVMESETKVVFLE